MATTMRSANLLRLGFRHVSFLLLQGPLCPAPSLGLGLGTTGLARLRCSAAEAADHGGKKVSARLALTQQVLRDVEERAASAGSDPPPKITLGATLKMLCRKYRQSLMLHHMFLLLQKSKRKR